MVMFIKISALFNGLVSLILAFYILTQNSRKHINRVLAIVTFCTAFWSLSFFFMLISDTYDFAFFWSKMFMLGSIFIPLSFFHFVLILLNLAGKKRREIVISYCISIILAVTVFTPFFISDLVQRLEFKFWPVPGTFFHIYMVIFFGYTIYAFYLMLQQYKFLSDIKRNQVKYVILGAAIAFIGGETNYLLCYDIPIPPYGNALISTYVISFTYAIIKYQLLDLRIIIKRGTILAVIFTLLFFLPVIGALYYESFLEHIFGKRWWIGFFVLGGVISYFAQITYIFLRDQMEKKLIKEQERFHSYLRDTSNNIQHIRNINDLQYEIVHSLMEGINIKYVKLFILNEQDKYYEIAAFKGDEKRAQTGKILHEGHSLIKLLDRTKEYILLDIVNRFDYDDVDINEIEEEMRAMGAALILPIYSQERLLGFIALGSKPEHKLYSIADINVLTALANQAALAMENALLYHGLEKKVEERTKELNEAYNKLRCAYNDLQKKDFVISQDMALAKKIQENLLFTNPDKIKNIGFNIIYIPVSEVGGDIYDIIEISPGHVRIFLADASGHGVQAALITMLIKSEYKQIKEINISPSELLNLLNNIFIDSYKNIPVLFTCVVVDIDLNNNKIVYSSAGHPAQVMIRNNTVQRLSHTGRIIGVTKKSKYKLIEMDFATNDKLLLFTDGIFEQFNSAREEFGEKRVLDIIERNRAGSSRTINNQIINEINTFIENEDMNDDIVIIEINRK